MELRDRFSSVEIAILGDVMLDQYWWGTVERISPEAPVPVVRLNDETVVPGGAANVAVNIAGLGARPILVGCIGKDAGAVMLCEHLHSVAIEPDRLVAVDGRPQRVVGGLLNHTRARIAREARKRAEFSGTSTASVPSPQSSRCKCAGSAT